ncbi:hypothetical protein [uncultured Xanthomonas sp.]|uniref:hypothetical protein n=1 Tax=uncultured Xanthomonas sp. TaxID=152831 RepID=UPI0025CD0B09|nr:hypothetical protein [uncultured Xanthomonas sp.]
MSCAACTTTSSDSKIKVGEKGSTSAVFENGSRSQFILIRFDGCVVRNELACDWIVEKVLTARVAIELKGADIEHAAKQIEAALDYMKKNGMSELKLGGLIVCTRYPSFDTTFQRIKQRIAKNFQAPIKVTRDARGISIESLIKF